MKTLRLSLLASFFLCANAYAQENLSNELVKKMTDQDFLDNYCIYDSSVYGLGAEINIEDSEGGHLLRCEFRAFNGKVARWMKDQDKTGITQAE